MNLLITEMGKRLSWDTLAQSILWKTINYLKKYLNQKKKEEKMAKEDKIYINMCWLREKVFDDGGSVINCAFNVEELQKHADENGWVNMVIKKRREPNEKGYTHYAEKDTWKPKSLPQDQHESFAGQEPPKDNNDEKMPWDD